MTYRKYHKMTNLKRRKSESSVRPQRKDERLFAPPPGEIPKLPADITLEDDSSLMALFACYVQWQNYAASELAEAENREARSEASMKLVEAKGVIKSWGGGKDDRVTVAKAERDASPEVQEAHQDYLNAKAYRKMVLMMYSNCERLSQLVSRELTRRVGRDGPERRNQRWNA